MTLISRYSRSTDAQITPEMRESALQAFADQHTELKREDVRNYADLLPYIIRLDGRPFRLDEYQPFKTLYDLDVPEEEVLISGRQVSKTTGISVRGTAMHAIQPYLRSLYVLPLQEMAKRLSQNFFKPFILQSPLRKMLLDANCEMNVFQRTFSNYSAMYFSYAFLDCDRCRGFPVDEINYDEVQDMDASFIPIINEAVSASDLAIKRYSGTPKTTDNTLNVLASKSSGGEWCMKCSHCGHYNIPTLEFDALKMIGPLSNVEEYGTGLRCGQCLRPIYGRDGFWLHEHPERISTLKGLHIPQIILPLHYASLDKWRVLIAKSLGDQTVFLNECMGIASDTASKLVTLGNLKAAATLETNNDLDEALHFCKNRYRQIFLGVDWGGGGVKEVSRTVVSVIGALPNGKYEVPYIEQFMSSLDGATEVARVIFLFSEFGASHLGHDYAGAGQQREDLLIQFGFPIDRILPFSYVRATSQPMIVMRTADGKGSRSYFSLDKTRSLLLNAEMIKTGLMRFPRFKSCETLLEQYLALQNEQTTPTRGGTMNLVTTRMDASDDVPQSINFGTACAFRVLDQYPDLAVAHSATLSKVQMRIASPGIEIDDDTYDPTFRI